MLLQITLTTKTVIEIWQLLAAFSKLVFPKKRSYDLKWKKLIQLF
jgi:hypothetical protein